MLPRIAYAVLFIVLVPTGLAVWAQRLDGVMHLPPLGSRPIGLITAGLGAVVMVWAMLDLWRFGGGLPMNAFPPARYVSRGAYGIVAHPIYLGFTLLAAGAALALGSPAGFWIVTPAVALGGAALVWGYERDAIRTRFGESATRPFLSLPPADEKAAGFVEKLGAALLVLIPWLIGYEWIGHLPAPDAVDVHFGFERNWSVLPWTQPIYASVYLAAPLAFLIVRSHRDVRDLGVTAAWGTTLGYLCFLAFPLVVPTRPIAGDSLFAEFLRFEQSDGVGARAACPSFHVFWAIITAWIVARTHRAMVIPVWIWALVVIVSCATTGMHALLDLPAGALLALIAIGHRRMLNRARWFAESIANAWQEWRLGPVRLINHAFFAGGAALIGALFAGLVLGARAMPYLAIIGVFTIVGAGLWGQAFVGRPNSSRPFGYFGAALGATAGAVVMGALTEFTFTGMAGALAVASPWVLVVGRMRCLIQGCCHGRATTVDWAIRYRHPRSRVCRASNMMAIPVHPTPLYSMTGSAIIGLLLMRLWSVGAGAMFTLGAYLILAGALRFVEEHYRGEPHTPTIAGLRIYQWFSIVSAIIGVIATSIDSTALPRAALGDLPVIALWSLAIGLMFAFAMGVDFPESNRRFARLT